MLHRSRRRYGETSEFPLPRSQGKFARRGPDFSMGVTASDRLHPAWPSCQDQISVHSSRHVRIMQPAGVAERSEPLGLQRGYRQVE